MKTIAYFSRIIRSPMPTSSRLLATGMPIDPLDYEIENATGKLSYGAAVAPIIVTYTGGYAPEEIPPALKAAAQLMIQGARAQLARTSGIRTVQHGESRVDYFGAMASTGKGGATPVSVAGDTVSNLLMSYMRLQV